MHEQHSTAGVPEYLPCRKVQQSVGYARTLAKEPLLAIAPDHQRLNRESGIVHRAALLTHTIGAEHSVISDPRVGDGIDHVHQIVYDDVGR